MQKWHQMTAHEAVAELKSNTQRGLSEAEVKERLHRYGPNELEAGRHVSAWSILFDQFKNVLVVILLLASLFSAFLGHSFEAIAIAVIVLFAVLLGFIQEHRAEKAIEALKKMAAPKASILREGEEREVVARELVPGDIILIRAGDKMPADARLIEAMNLQTDEASLTGESLPVEKQVDSLPEGEFALGDRKNLVYSGTAATYGRAKGVIVATGMETEFGRIAGMLTAVEIGKTPLQQNLDKVGHVLARAALLIVLLIVGLGLLRGEPLLQMIIFGIALAVAVVPEALPAVVTISLAIGVQRMVKRNALIRRLPAVETLGATSVICSDKTGTLTRDEMTVQKIYVDNQMVQVSGSGYAPQGEFSQNGSRIEPSESLLALLRAGALASDVALLQNNGHWTVKGDPTEGALVVAAAKAGLEKAELERQFPRIHEIPFSSESKRMTTLHQTSSGTIAYSKGAPEVILNSCISRLSEGGETGLDPHDREKILAGERGMAAGALRVLALASKAGASPESADREMTFLGLVGMIDPPRPEAKAAVKKCEEAGIKVTMITGDHPLTAEAIARELDILKEGRVVTGVQMESMSDAQLERDIEEIEVYARVSPSHKLRVVSAMQKKGFFVAMTGDGVNDAPALKKADIGIAMGITGTDVSKEAAAMILIDDNFASIVAAVEEGRAVFANIKKYLMYLLSSNIGEIALIMGATLLGYPMPLSALQILYVNLVTDGLPALALSVDPPEEDLMRRRPRDPRTGIFTRPVLTLMTVGGLWSGLVNMGLFTWAIGSGRSLKEAMSMTFVSLVLIQFFKAYNFRSDRNSVLHRPFSNKWLNLSIFSELILQVLILYIPLMQMIFGTFGLTGVDWIIIVIAAFTVSPILETAKWMERRGWFGKISE